VKRVLTNAVAESNLFRAIIKKLQKFYGRPKPPHSTDPLEIILFDNVAYLVDDEKRAAAFAALKKKVGTRPEQILKASLKQLEEITRLGGMAPEVRAQRLRQIAELVHYIFKDNLAAELKRPLPQAKKSLKRFPSIGDPGAEKILMLTRSHPVLALESNGLRVLLRLGFAEEKKSYSASYRGVQQALAGQLPDDYDALIAAHQLLRQQGQELCKRTRPLCDAGCPLTAECRYFQNLARQAQRPPA
jgi:endonuclease III